MQRFVAGNQQASDLEVKERQVKAASKNVVRDAIERDEKLQVHTCQEGLATRRKLITFQCQ